MPPPDDSGWFIGPDGILFHRAPRRSDPPPAEPLIVPSLFTRAPMSPQAYLNAIELLDAYRVEGGEGVKRAYTQMFGSKEKDGPL